MCGLLLNTSGSTTRAGAGRRAGSARYAAKRPPSDAVSVISWPMLDSPLRRHRTMAGRERTIERPVLGSASQNGREHHAIERFMVPGELEPVSHYCHVVKAGDFVYLSGMVGMKAD